MNDLFDNFGQPDLSPAERRLDTDGAFGPLNYHDDPSLRDQYFREGLMLLRQIPNQPEKVRAVIASYLRCVTDPALALELQTFLQTLQSETSANLARPGAQ